MKALRIVLVRFLVGFVGGFEQELTPDLPVTLVPDLPGGHLIAFPRGDGLLGFSRGQVGIDHVFGFCRFGDFPEQFALQVDLHTCAQAHAVDIDGDLLVAVAG